MYTIYSKLRKAVLAFMNAVSVSVMVLSYSFLMAILFARVSFSCVSLQDIFSISRCKLFFSSSCALICAWISARLTFISSKPAEGLSLTQTRRLIRLILERIYKRRAICRTIWKYSFGDANSIKRVSRLGTANYISRAPGWTFAAQRRAETSWIHRLRETS